MKFKTALFYHGFIVYYNVYLVAENFYKIKLDVYRGKTDPPSLIKLYKNGYRWQSDCNDFELIKELGAAIEQRIQ